MVYFERLINGEKHVQALTVDTSFLSTVISDMQQILFLTKAQLANRSNEDIEKVLNMGSIAGLQFEYRINDVTNDEDRRLEVRVSEENERFILNYKTLFLLLSDMQFDEIQLRSYYDKFRKYSSSPRQAFICALLYHKAKCKGKKRITLYKKATGGISLHRWNEAMELKRKTRIDSLHLYVPPSKRLNYDEDFKTINKALFKKCAVITK